MAGREGQPCNRFIMKDQSFPQNIIAVIWDYDKTLIPHNMQKPLFEKYAVVEGDFWAEVDEKSKQIQIESRVSPELVYLNQIVSYVKKGKFAGLNNAELFELGKELQFYPGLPEFFDEMKKAIEQEQRYSKHEIKLEHYVVSTGIRKMIEGSTIAPNLTDIWGGEFFETVDKDGNLVLSEVVYVLDHTTKTRAIFEINKGANFAERIELNARMDENQRRVPIKQMIYVGDGPSDVPVFSVVKRNGGKCLAVHGKSSNSYDQAYDLLMGEERVHHIGSADFDSDSDTSKWLIRAAKDIADKIVERKEQALDQSIGQAPKHIST